MVARIWRQHITLVKAIINLRSALDDTHESKYSFHSDFKCGIETFCGHAHVSLSTLRNMTKSDLIRRLRKVMEKEEN